MGDSAKGRMRRGIGKSALQGCTVLRHSRGECLGLIDIWRVTRIIRCHLLLVLVEVEGGVYLRLPCKQFPQLLLLLERLVCLRLVVGECFLQLGDMLAVVLGVPFNGS